MEGIKMSDNKKMRRLTFDDVNRMGMYDLAHNMCFVKNSEAWYRDFENEMSIRDLVRVLAHGQGIELPQDDESLDEEMCGNTAYIFDDDLDGVFGLLYQFAWAMADLRERLKYYEDRDKTLLDKTIIES